MNLDRAEAFDILKKFADGGKPLLGFTVSAWGVSLFGGSIVHLDTDCLIVNQNHMSSEQPVFIPMIVFITEQTSFQYGDMREFTSRIPPDALNQPDFQRQMAALSNVIEGGLVLEYRERTEVVGLVELDFNAVGSSS